MPKRTPTAETATDEDLAIRAASGSRGAFEELVERWAGPVLAVLERRLADPHLALDLSQDVWVRVFRALAGFRPHAGIRPGGSFRSWLFSIALNAARDEGRRSERSPILYMEEFRGDVEGADPTEQAAERRAVEAALLELAEPFRTALALVDLVGLTYEEAADSLGCAVGTVKSRVNRGRLAFRDLWERSGVEMRAGGSS